MTFMTCKTCKNRKSETDFYWHKSSSAYLSSCKECVKEKVMQYRQKNIEKVREYDRKRGQAPARRQRVRDNAWKYKRDVKPWRASNAEKYRAHIAVGNALRSGALVRPKTCERCKNDLPLHGHHEDYSKPLIVVWLCHDCHGERHREINDERRQLSKKAAEG